MPNLSAAGSDLVQALTARYGLSADAATHMLIAVHHGNGSMAQFNHPEFGGCGQWMRGGMTMVSDLFNYQLKSLVDSVCNDISNELAMHQLVPRSGSFQSQSQNGSSPQSQSAGSIGSENSLFVPDPDASWWPRDLGTPAAVGSQNNVRYAYFPKMQRLAVNTGGETWIYDTLSHNIGGFAQQQGVGGSITFTSQLGTVNLTTLPVVSRGGVPVPQAASPPPSAVVQELQAVSQEETVPLDGPVLANNPMQADVKPDANRQEDVIDTLDRLGSLMTKGYITDEEFAAKKAELLSRL